MNIETNNDSSSKKVVFDDDFDFRPLTDGLGFHHRKEDLSKRKITEFSKKDIHLKNYQELFLEKSDKVEVPAEVSIFYQKEAKTPDLNKKLVFEMKEEVKVGMGTRFVSWFLDSIFISIICFSIFSLMIFISDLRGIGLNDFFQNGSNLFYPLILAILIYFVFKIAIGFRTSPGQKFLGIRPSFKNLKGSAHYFLLKRTALEILGIFSFGLVYLLSLDEKFLGNEVIK